MDVNVRIVTQLEAMIIILDTILTVCTEHPEWKAIVLQAFQRKLFQQSTEILTKNKLLTSKVKAQNQTS